MMKQLSISLSLVLMCYGSALGTVLMSDNFDSYSNTAELSASAWDIDTARTSIQTSGCASGNCARMEYSSADNFHQLSRSLGNGYPEGYIGFRAKVTDKYGSWPKFLKFFGAGYPTTYSNWTMNQQYSTVKLHRIQHGGSNTPVGDNTCVADWVIPSVTCSGTLNYYSGTNFTFPDENWHDFVVYWKLSTDGNSNGGWKVWIDGDLQMDVSGVKNRNDSHTRGFQFFAFGDYTDSGNLTSTKYYIWYDDFAIASTYAEADPSDGTTYITCYPDVDNDFYPGSGSELVETCSANYYESPHFISSMTEDCDDTDASINPGATEICGNAVDEDCSGVADSCDPPVGEGALSNGGTGTLANSGSGTLSQ